MKQVFKGLVTAMKKALKASLKAMAIGLRFGTTAAMLPLAAVRDGMAMLFGGGQADDLPEPEIASGALDLDEIEDEVERDEVLKSRLLHKVQPHTAAYEWACTPLERRQYVDLGKLPLPAAVWLKKLSEPELHRVRVAGLQAMCDHLAGQRMIPGVSKPRMSLKDFTACIAWDDDMPLADRSEMLISSAQEARAQSMRLH